MPSGAEVRVVSASVIAQLQAQGLQVRFYTKSKYAYTSNCIKKKYLQKFFVLSFRLQFYCS